MSEEVVHSELGASSYSRWRECPGSVALCRGVPKKSSIYAEEGTRAHEIASNILLGNGPKEPIDAEMLSAITVYLDYIQSLRERKPSFEAIEQKLDLSEYHPKLFGTADYVCYFPVDKVLHVVDYKHGAGVPVEVEENEQLLYYGLGALHENKFPIKKVILTVVQPRCFHEGGPVRSWSCGPMDILEYAATLCEDAIKTEQADAPLKVGDHCRWCAAQPVCPARHKTAVETAKSVFTPVTSYDPEKLATTLRALDQIEAWAKSVRSFAYSEAEAGRIPPGFKLVDKRATRKWREGVDGKTLSKEFKSFGNHFYTTPEIKSVAQIEKLISKEEKVILDSLTVKESSGKNLVEDNEKNANRMPVAPKAIDVFN